MVMFSGWEVRSSNIQALPTAGSEAGNEDERHFVDPLAVCEDFVFVFLCLHHPQRRQKRYFLGRPIRPSFHSSGQILLPRYLMNSLNSIYKTDREYSLAPTD